MPTRPPPSTFAPFLIWHVVLALRVNLWQRFHFHCFAPVSLGKPNFRGFQVLAIALGIRDNDGQFVVPVAETGRPIESRCREREHSKPPVDWGSFGDSTSFITSGTTNMTRFVQVAAIIAIPIGAGVCAFGRRLGPQPNLVNAAAEKNVRPQDRDLSAATCGWGVGIITLGMLGLAVPWFNTVARKSGWIDSAAS